MIEIMPFQPADAEHVISLVLECQNDGTRPLVTVADQPDLLDIETGYRRSGGNFWVAKENGQLIGTIGLMPQTKELALLRKFFVHASYRGAPHHLGQRLFSVLLAFARQAGYKTLLLDTPKNTERAHRFYEKAGFTKIDASALPIHYAHPYAESDFFLLSL